MVERGLAKSRERAQALVLAGRVRIDGRPAGKPGMTVPVEAAVEVTGPDHPFVGRGGVKLEGALTFLALDPAGRIAIDVGASTGGFTDCLLRRGARRVLALDVGTGQLDWSLRNDPRVTVLEGINARHLEATDLPETPDLAVVDVSFISLRLVLPALAPLLREGADIVALVKPQFEVGREDVGAGGIVRDPRLHRAAVLKVADTAARIGCRFLGGCASPITGAEGNREFFLHLRTGAATDAAPDLDLLVGRIVDG